MSLSETFRVLANLLKSGAIKEFALTRTTIEQVFTNFAKFQINDSNQAYAALPTSASPRVSERGKPLRPLSGTPTDTKSSAVDSAEAKRREASRRLEARLEYRPPPEAMPSYESDPGSPAADSASESASDHSPARLEQRDRDADDALAAVAALRVSNKVSASRAPKKAAVSPVAPSTASPSARGPREIFLFPVVLCALRRVQIPWFKTNLTYFQIFLALR